MADVLAMSQEERWGRRPGEYSAWHRRGSIRRFVGLEKAQLLSMCDVDASLWVEYDDRTKEPLALIETARDVGQAPKAATVLKRLARRARLPAYVCCYTVSSRPNPSDGSYGDIASFKIRRVWPKPEAGWREMTPQEWATGLIKIREWSAAKIDRAANDPTY